ncbi:TIGR03773 family transporter-associated surface protein [Asanoa siamensis]|uniref:ABC transporter-associated repeat protein n=1 Tax=Asanoa siamensis TaxID=926357 RepID=A0ABQ4CTI4_9ACTN|nr:TIGR03773 family transporter-associated surface protein [Asanoa siamensis]GIF74597.1 hypothetical protein Asi02nite_41150 [Asanoa siamensis]
MKRTAAAIICVAGVTALSGPLPARAEPRTLSVAGADLVSVRVESDGLVLNTRDAGQVRAGHPGTDPSHVTLDAGDGFTGTAPDRLSFLGPPGTPVWVLAADGDFPAFDATGVPTGRLADDTLTVELVGVDGPGQFHAYAQSGLGAVDLLLGSAASEPTTTVLRAGHRRGGVLWAFDTPGSYQVALAVTGRERGGRELRDEATFRVEVPPISVSETAAPPEAKPSPAAPRRAAEAKNAPGVAAPAPPPRVVAPAPPPKGAPASGRKVIADGHVDMGPSLNGSSWTIRLRDDTTSPAAWRNLSDVVLHVVDKAKIKVPAGSEYAFLGRAGSDVWMLPQAQQAGIVWPGWNTQDPSVVNGTRGAVTWRLTSVTGPGQFKLFLTGSFGRPEVLFDSGRKLPQQLAIPPNTHAHGSWAFTRPGIYHLGVEMAGTAKDGKALVDRRTLNIAVGDVDPDGAFGAPGGDPGSGGEGGRLAQTGASWTIAAALLGSGLVVGGGVLVVGARRRRGVEG